MAGEPVVFNIKGNVDNLLFYSGEIGSEYQNKDRYSVPVKDVKSATLKIEYQAQYGKEGAMEVWISNKFSGLNGEDGEADRKTISKMVQTMDGWKKLDYVEGKSGIWTEQSYVLTDSLDSKTDFCIAFHWNPKEYCDTVGGMKYIAQRTYRVNGTIDLSIADVLPMPIDFSGLSFKTVMMNTEADAYHKNAGNGSIVLNSNTVDLLFQGVGQKDSLDYAIDAWAISSPIDLNRVENDKGIVIKNQQNYLSSYSYTWNEPGTYKVVFVGTNENYQDSSMLIREISVTILENITNVL